MYLGSCKNCGYSKNHAALEFHHVDLSTKSFQLDLRSLSNRRWSVIVEEAKKCILLCSNCHAELHNPDCTME
jgi:predicted HNH restriction endonuclease